MLRAFFVLSLVISAASCSAVTTDPCGPANCQGCCSLDGQCQLANPETCGSNGGFCVKCVVPANATGLCSTTCTFTCNPGYVATSGNDACQPRGAWTEAIPTGRHPMARSDHAMVYDSARQRVVLFGGSFTTNAPIDDTWEWDGSAWTTFAPAVAPSARYGHAMAYDEARQVTVVFGGLDTTGVLNDTWLWDGTRWTSQPTPSAPRARAWHAMAYDAERQKVVLFGGSVTIAEQLNDVWELDALGWTQRQVSAIPARYRHAMAYDKLRKQLVVFGGIDSTNTGLRDGWVLEGTTWRSIPNSPVQSFDHTLVWDETRGDVLIFGGAQGRFISYSTSAWNGERWANLAVQGAAPPLRTDHAMAYDAARRTMVLFGGEGSTDKFEDTWLLAR